MIFSLVDRILFPATRDVYATPAAMGWEYQDLALDVDGEGTHGWWIPHPHPRATVLFSHGNAGNIADRLQSIGLLREMGFSVLAYDYGGYGKSSGKAGEERFYADIRAMWAWLTETKGVPPEEIILFGRSLGAAVTAQLATEVRPVAVILESTFLSMPKVAKVHTWLPVQFLIRHKFHHGGKGGADPESALHHPQPGRHADPLRPR